MQFALVEWLVLARSDLILHTYGSSFAMEVRRKQPSNQYMRIHTNDDDDENSFVCVYLYSMP